MKTPEWPIQDHKEFIEWAIEKRVYGETWLKMAKTLGIGRATLYEFFDKFPDIQTKIDAKVDKLQIEALRQTGMELAIKNKDRQLLQFMLKAKAKMYDVPHTEAKQEEQVQAMTKEEALKLLEARNAVQKKS